MLEMTPIEKKLTLETPVTPMENRFTIQTPLAPLKNHFTIKTPMALLDILEEGVIDKDIELTSDMFQKQIIDTAGWKFGDSPQNYHKQAISNVRNPIRNKKKTISPFSEQKGEGHELDKIVQNLLSPKRRKRSSRRRIVKFNKGEKKLGKNEKSKGSNAINKEKNILSSNADRKNEKNNLEFKSEDFNVFGEEALKSQKISNCNTDEQYVEQSRVLLTKKQKPQKSERTSKLKDEISTGKAQKSRKSSRKKNYACESKLCRKMVSVVNASESSQNMNFENVTDFRLPDIYPVVGGNESKVNSALSCCINQKESDFSLAVKQKENLDLTNENEGGVPPGNNGMSLSLDCGKRKTSSTTNDNVFNICHEKTEGKESLVISTSKENEKNVGSESDLTEELTESSTDQTGGISFFNNSNEKANLIGHSNASTNLIEQCAQLSTSQSEENSNFENNSTLVKQNFVNTEEHPVHFPKPHINFPSVQDKEQLKQKSKVFANYETDYTLSNMSENNSEHKSAAVQESEGGLDVCDNKSLKQALSFDETFTESDSTETEQDCDMYESSDAETINSVDECTRNQNLSDIKNILNKLLKPNVCMVTQRNSKRKQTKKQLEQSLITEKCSFLKQTTESHKLDDVVQMLCAPKSPRKQRSRSNVKKQEVDETKMGKDIQFGKCVICGLMCVLGRPMQMHEATHRSKIKLSRKENVNMNSELAYMIEKSPLKNRNQSKMPRKKNCKISCKSKIGIDKGNSIGNNTSVYEELNVEQNKAVSIDNNMNLIQKDVNNVNILQNINGSVNDNVNIIQNHIGNTNVIMSNGKMAGVLVMLPTDTEIVQQPSTTVIIVNQNPPNIVNPSCNDIAGSKVGNLTQDIKTVSHSVQNELSEQNVILEGKRQKHLGCAEGEGQKHLGCAEGEGKKHLECAEGEGHENIHVHSDANTDNQKFNGSFMNILEETNDQSTVGASQNKLQSGQGYVKGQGQKEIAEFKRQKYLTISGSEKLDEGCENLESLQNTKSREVDTSCNELKLHGECKKVVKVIIVKDSLSQEQLEVPITTCQCSDLQTENSDQESQNSIYHDDSLTFDPIDNSDSSENFCTLFQHSGNFKEHYKKKYGKIPEVTDDHDMTVVDSCARTDTKFKEFSPANCARTRTCFKHLDDLFKHKLDLHKHAINSEIIDLSGETYSERKKMYVQMFQMNGQNFSDTNKENVINLKLQQEIEKSDKFKHVKGSSESAGSLKQLIQSRIKVLMGDHSSIISPPKKRWRSYLKKESDDKYTDKISDETKTNKFKRKIDFKNGNFGIIANQIENGDMFSDDFDTNECTNLSVDLLDSKYKNPSVLCTEHENIQISVEGQRSGLVQSSVKREGSLSEVQSSAGHIKAISTNKSTILHHIEELVEEKYERCVNNENLVSINVKGDLDFCENNESDPNVIDFGCARLFPFTLNHHQCARVIPTDFNNSARTRPIRK